MKTGAARGGKTMGKLVLALRKRQQEIDRLSGPDAVSYQKDPATGYRNMSRINALEYQNKLAARKITKALKTLPPEKVTDYFDKTLNDGAKEDLALLGFQETIADSRTEKDGLRKLTEFVADKERFGASVDDTLAALEKVIRPEKLKRYTEKMPPDISKAERVARLLQSVTTSEHAEIYHQLIPKEKHADYLHRRIRNAMRKDTLHKVLTDNENYRTAEGSGQRRGDWIGALEQLEGSIDGQTVERLAAEIEQIPDPKSVEGSIVRPREDRIRELNASIREDDPAAAEKRSLVERAGKILEYPSKQYLDYMNLPEISNLPDDRNVMKANEVLGYQTTTQFLGGLGENGEYIRKLPSMSSHTGVDFYDPVSVTPPKADKKGRESGIELTGKDKKVFADACTGKTNEKSRHAIMDIMKGFDEIGEKKFWNRATAELVEGTWDDPVKVKFLGEQGNKKYAFWPLVNAKQALNRAIGDGDWEKIRTSTEEYERIRGVTDRMMRNVNEATALPGFPGNLNSTRAESDGSLNPVPAEYLEDFPGHSRLNGLFLLYAISKNTGIPVERFIDDPLGACQDMAGTYVKQNVQSKFRGKSLAAQLRTGFDNSAAMTATATWGQAIMGPLWRGLGAAGNMMPTREEQVSFQGKAYCGVALASHQVGEQINAWNSLAESSPEMRMNIVQMAMLDEDFDLLETGKRISRKEGRSTFSADAWICEKLKTGDLKPDKLAERTKKFLEEAAADTPESYDDYRKAAIRNYDTILRSATPRQRQSESFRAIREHASELRQAAQRDILRSDSPDVREPLQAVNDSLTVLRKEKEGWFLSKTDTEEFKDMRKKVEEAHRQMLLIGGGGSKEPQTDPQGKTEQRDLGTLLSEARQSCFDYVFKKTDGGTSSVWHEAGRDRLDAAKAAFEQLGMLEDQLGLRSPAREEMDKARMTALESRGSKHWLKNKSRLTAAVFIVSLSLEKSGYSAEKQEALLGNSKSYRRTLDKVMSDPAFLRMMSNEGEKGIADKMIQGKEALTEAFEKAQRQVSAPQKQEGSGRIQDVLTSVVKEEAQEDGPSLGAL